tara:strand:+ start:884 stop:1834 length:951 start_codon:yes stop_codon:yes gene_type:complete
MDLNILLTGSSGFLGIRLSEILSKTNHRITALDISAPKKKYGNFEYKVMSINNYLEHNKESLNKFDLIIHTATVLPFKGKKKDLYETNIVSSLNLIKQISNLDSVFFVYVSSSGIYGKPFEIPVQQSTKFNPLDTYAETKLETEINLAKYLNNSNYAVIRPRTIMGMSRKGIFEIFFKLIKYNIPIPLPNKGRQIIQFVDVNDLSRLILHIGMNKISGNWPAGAPNPKSLKEHLDSLGTKIEKKVRYISFNSKFFEFLGNILVSLKLVKFTKWHFGSFPLDFYFDPLWVPDNFEYELNNEEAFFNSAKTYFLNLDI